MSISDFKKNEEDFFQSAKNTLNPDVNLAEALSHLNFSETTNLQHKIPPNVDVRRKEFKNYLPVNALNSGSEIRFEIDDQMSIPLYSIYFVIQARYIFRTLTPTDDQLTALNFCVPDNFLDFMFSKISVTVGTNNREIDNTSVNVPIGATIKKIITTPYDYVQSNGRQYAFYKDPGALNQPGADGKFESANTDADARSKVYAINKWWRVNYRLPHGFFDLNKILSPHVKLYIRLTLNGISSYCIGRPAGAAPPPFSAVWMNDLDIVFDTFEMRCLGWELSDEYSALFKKAIAERTLRSAEQQVNLLEFNIDRNLYSSGIYDVDDYRVMSSSIPSNTKHYNWQILTANPLPSAIFWVYITRNSNPDRWNVNPIRFAPLQMRSRVTINSKSIPNWDTLRSQNVTTDNGFRDLDEYEQFRNATGYMLSYITNAISIQDWQAGYTIYGRALNQTGNPEDVTPLLQGSLNLEIELQDAAANDLQIVALLNYKNVYFSYSDRRFDIAYAY